MIAEKGLEPLDALRPLWEAGYSIERVVPGRDGERYGLQAIECEADAPRDLCTLICRP
jgi:hypothetical protein